MHLCEDVEDFSNCQALSVAALSSVAAIPVNISHRKFVFAVHTGNNKCTWLQASSETEQQNWILVIQKAMGVL